MMSSTTTFRRDFSRLQKYFYFGCDLFVPCLLVVVVVGVNGFSKEAATAEEKTFIEFISRFSPAIQYSKRLDYMTESNSNGKQNLHFRYFFDKNDVRNCHTQK